MQMGSSLRVISNKPVSTFPAPNESSSIPEIAPKMPKHCKRKKSLRADARLSHSSSASSSSLVASMLARFDFLGFADLSACARLSRTPAADASPTP